MEVRVSEATWLALRAELVRFVEWRVGSAEVAAEIVQDVLLRGVVALPGLDDPGRLRAWLFQASRNAIVDHYRARRPHLGSMDVPVETPDEVQEAEERLAMSRCLAPLLEQLPERYADAVRRVDLEGATHRQVAGDLGLSVSGVKSRVQRGRGLLRDALLACCELERGVRGLPTRVGSPGACGCSEPAASCDPESADVP